MVYGWNSSASVFVLLLALLSVLKEFCRSENIIYVERGQSAILFCNVSKSSWPTWDGPGLHGINFSTYADKLDINSNLLNAKKIQIIGNLNAGEYNMKITNISSKEEGFYRCTEFISHEIQPKITIVKLQINDTPMNITITVKHANNGVLRGKENIALVLNCSVDNLTKASIMWYNGSSLLGIGGPKMYDFKIVPQRYDHNKTYTCIVNSSKFRQDLNKTVKLDIKYTPVVTLNKEMLITVDEGQNLTLVCLVDSNPAPNLIYFEKDGCILNVINSTNSLDLININRERTGTYECKAENGIGKGYANVKVSVNYNTNTESRPKFFWYVFISLFCGMLIGSVLSSLLVMTYIRHTRRRAEIQQVSQGQHYHEIGTLTSPVPDHEPMPTNLEHNITESNMSIVIISDDNEPSSETDSSNAISNRSTQEEQVQRYENVYQPLELDGTEIHVYTETCDLNAGNSSNYLNTQIFNAHV